MEERRACLGRERVGEQELRQRAHGGAVVHQRARETVEQRAAPLDIVLQPPSAAAAERGVLVAQP